MSFVVGDDGQLRHQLPPFTIDYTPASDGETAVTIIPVAHPAAAPYCMIRHPDGSATILRERPPAELDDGSFVAQYIPRSVMYSNGVISPFDRNLLETANEIDVVTDPFSEPW